MEWPTAVTIVGLAISSPVWVGTAFFLIMLIIAFLIVICALPVYAFKRLKDKYIKKKAQNKAEAK
ncbi:hypothetical protein EV210_101176 [Anaerospora hongkongensis]|uniref:Uncharacterized protein n=1 Tax=Anaerospora hongkongensis TaxID=244830 RepID=A0A4R1Q5Y8_9FIRM|nr:hypothetical protein EV210_101176 [Anaerospora hongkongensis]